MKLGSVYKKKHMGRELNPKLIRSQKTEEVYEYIISESQGWEQPFKYILLYFEAVL